MAKYNLHWKKEPDRTSWHPHPHPKKYLNFFGGVLFLGGMSPKTPTFTGSDPERLERGPQYSARRRTFQKSPRTFVVLRLGDNPSQRKCTSFQYPQCPNEKKTKKCRFCPFRHWFQPNGQGTAVFKMSSLSLTYPPIQTQNWKCTWDFWKFCLWAEIMGCFCRPFEAQSEKLVHF